MKKKYFGTDGIRGIVDEFPITVDFFFDLTKAIKKTFRDVQRILIGMDTRQSCKKIENALVSGFSDLNIKTDTCGIVSTPILSFNTKKFKYDLGIMISASHNPYTDNGVKIFNKNGEKLSDFDEIKIEKHMELTSNLSDLKLKSNNNFLESSLYEKELLNRFSELANFNKRIIMDCANGSLYRIGPTIFNKLKLNFINYACNPDGKNINKNCGAMNPKILSYKTTTNNADIGISFDGDADRVIFCDENGRIVDGDYILAILSISLKKKKRLKHDTVIGTKMANIGLRSFFKKNRIKFLLADVGDRYVIEMMKKNYCSLGGEQSGHIIFSNNSFCGDGILTALSILNILREEQVSLSNLCKNLFVKTPQKLVNLKLKSDPLLIVQNKKILKLIKKIDKDDNSDILIRKSGTENLLRLMVQASTIEIVDKNIEDLIFQIRELDGE